METTSFLNSPPLKLLNNCTTFVLRYNNNTTFYRTTIFYLYIIYYFLNKSNLKVKPSP